MHAVDLDPAIIYDQKRGQYLTDEFFDGRNNEDIIFQSQKENNQGGRNKILELRRELKIDRKQTTEYKPCKNADAAQWDGRQNDHENSRGGFHCLKRPGSGPQDQS